MPRTRTIPLFCLLLWPLSGAWAGTDTTTFDVTATVEDACTVSADNLEFGSYDPFSATPRDHTTTITVRCTLGATYDIKLDKGTHGTSVTERRMQHETEMDTHLNYGLYPNAAREQNWGETIGTDTESGVGTGDYVAHTVHGRIPAEQDVPAGNYTDTINVTLEW